ncbi:hypothetical protein GCM10025734_53090 [Kitasatospora paranensis]
MGRRGRLLTPPRPGAMTLLAVTRILPRPLSARAVNLPIGTTSWEYGHGCARLVDHSCRRRTGRHGLGGMGGPHPRATGDPASLAEHERFRAAMERSTTSGGDR